MLLWRPSKYRSVFERHVLLVSASDMRGRCPSRSRAILHFLLALTSSIETACSRRLRDAARAHVLVQVRWIKLHDTLSAYFRNCLAVAHMVCTGTTGFRIHIKAPHAHEIGTCSTIRGTFWTRRQSFASSSPSSSG